MAALNMKPEDLDDLNLKRVQPWWIGAPALVLVIGMFLWAGHEQAQETKARNAILDLLNGPREEFVVTVNGWSPPNADAMLSALRGLHKPNPQHTHTVHDISVVIQRNARTLELTLRRDSALPQQYWVFCECGRCYLDQAEIGRIETSAFDRE